MSAALLEQLQQLLADHHAASQSSWLPGGHRRQLELQLADAQTELQAWRLLADQCGATWLSSAVLAVVSERLEALQ